MPEPYTFPADCAQLRADIAAATDPVEKERLQALLNENCAGDATSQSGNNTKPPPHP